MNTPKTDEFRERDMAAPNETEACKIMSEVLDSHEKLEHELSIQEAAIKLQTLSLNTMFKQLTAEQEKVKQLREALSMLVASYEDVPDPTDSEGQQLFNIARATLEKTK